MEDRINKILIVDDDRDLNDLIKLTLSKEGYNAENAYTGKSAIEWASKNPSSLILLDYKLSDLTAQEIIYELNKKKVNFYFIVMTGHGDENLAVKLMKSGAKDYIVKSTKLTYILPAVITRVLGEIEKERKLKRTENELRLKDSVVASSLNGVAIADLDGIITYVNDTFLNLWGYKDQNEVIGKKAIVFWENKENAFEVMNILLKKKKYIGELIAKKKNGSSFTAQVLAKLITDETGKPSKFMSTFQDVSQFKKIEKELKDSEEKYHLLFEKMHNGFAFHEMILNKKEEPIDYRFLDVNPSFERLTGLKAKDIKGKTVKEVIPQIEDYWIERYGKVALTGKPDSFTEYSKAFNKYYKIEAFSPQYKQFVCIFNDVTDEKNDKDEMNNLLMDRQSKNRDLEQILNIISQDIKSPILNIDGFIHEIEDTLNNLIVSFEKKSGSEIRDMCKIKIEKIILKDINYIKMSMSKINSLISGISQINRIGRINLKVVKIDMNKLIANVLIDFKFQLDEKKIKIEIKQLPVCYGDNFLVGQLFSNLISNAIKFMAGDGSGKLFIYGEERGDNANIYVKDNGIGIKKEHQEKIFDVFQKLNVNKEGEGLGLAIVQRIVKRHNGAIEIESEQGKGSKFIVKFPTN